MSDRRRRKKVVPQIPAPPVLNEDCNYTFEQARQYLNIGRTTLYRQIKAGNIRPTKIAGRMLLNGREIRRISMPASAPEAAQSAA